MENFDFDNKIKQGMENINPMLDNDEIWNNIEPHLKKKRKRRFIIWFFFGALTLLGLIWFQSESSLSKTSVAKDASSQETSSNLVVKNANTSDLATSQIEDLSSKNKEIEKVSQERQLANTHKIDQITKLSKPVLAKFTNVQSFEVKQVIEKISNKPPQPVTTGRDINQVNGLLEKKDSEIENIYTSPEPTLLNPKSTHGTKTDINKTEIIEEIPSAISTKPKITGNSSSKDNKDVRPQVDETIITTNLPKKEEPEIKKKLTKKERAEANKKRKKARKKAKKEKVKKKKEAEAKKKKNKLTKPNKIPKWKFHIQLIGSGIYTIHGLQDGNRSESEYLSNRKKFVNGTEGFGTEIRFATESPSGLILTSGIQYQELHEKLNRQETESISKLQEVTETVTENAEGNVISSTTSMQLVTTTTTYNQQLYNQYRFVNFPIGIGYAFKTRKMRLKLIGGIDLNTYFKFSGSMFNRDLSIFKLQSKSSTIYDNIYKNTTGIGIWASVEWHKPINERLSLIVTPSFQAPINSISQNNEEWPISHRLLKLKLGVGINYVLGGTKKTKQRARIE